MLSTAAEDQKTMETKKEVATPDAAPIASITLIDDTTSIDPPKTSTTTTTSVIDDRILIATETEIETEPKTSPISTVTALSQASMSRRDERQLALSDLAPDISMRALRDWFEQFGPLQLCQVTPGTIRVSSTGQEVRANSTALVIFRHSSAADQAYHALFQLKKPPPAMIPISSSGSRSSSSAMMGGTGLLVSNMAPDWSHRDLRARFEAFGEISDARVIEPAVGYVRFKHEAHALTAVKMVDGQLVAGHKWRVSLCATCSSSSSSSSSPAAAACLTDQVKKSSKKPNLHNLYVRHLPYDCEPKQVQRWFEPYGEICSVRMMGHDWGFVRFERPEGARRAIEALNGAVIGAGGVPSSAAADKGPDCCALAECAAGRQPLLVEFALYDWANHVKLKKKGGKKVAPCDAYDVVAAETGGAASASASAGGGGGGGGVRHSHSHAHAHGYGHHHPHSHSLHGYHHQQQQQQQAYRHHGHCTAAAAGHYHHQPMHPLMGYEHAGHAPHAYAHPSTSTTTAPATTATGGSSSYYYSPYPTSGMTDSVTATTTTTAAGSVYGSVGMGVAGAVPMYHGAHYGGAALYPPPPPYAQASTGSSSGLLAHHAAAYPTAGAVMSGSGVEPATTAATTTGAATATAMPLGMPTSFDLETMSMSSGSSSLLLAEHARRLGLRPGDIAKAAMLQLLSMFASDSVAGAGAGAGAGGSEAGSFGAPSMSGSFGVLGAPVTGVAATGSASAGAPTVFSAPSIISGTSSADSITPRRMVVAAASGGESLKDVKYELKMRVHREVCQYVRQQHAGWVTGKLVSLGEAKLKGLMEDLTGAFRTWLSRAVDQLLKEGKIKEPVYVASPGGAS